MCVIKPTVHTAIFHPKCTPTATSISDLIKILSHKLITSFTRNLSIIQSMLADNNNSDILNKSQQKSKWFSGAALINFWVSLISTKKTFSIFIIGNVKSISKHWIFLVSVLKINLHTMAYACMLLIVWLIVRLTFCISIPCVAAYIRKRKDNMTTWIYFDEIKHQTLKKRNMRWDGYKYEQKSHKIE